MSCHSVVVLFAIIFIKTKVCSKIVKLFALVTKTLSFLLNRLARKMNSSIPNSLENIDSEKSLKDLRNHETSPILSQTEIAVKVQVEVSFFIKISFIQKSHVFEI